MSKQRYSIVGTNFTGIPESFMMELQPGENAVLVREPNNQFDPNAVAVWIKGHRVGYIPRKQNAVLAAFIDQNAQMLNYSGAMDQVGEVDVAKAIPAVFRRSPNSNYPMVEV